MVSAGEERRWKESKELQRAAELFREVGAWRKAEHAVGRAGPVAYQHFTLAEVLDRMASALRRNELPRDVRTSVVRFVRAIETDPVVVVPANDPTYKSVGL